MLLLAGGPERLSSELSNQQWGSLQGPCGPCSSSPVELRLLGRALGGALWRSSSRPLCAQLSVALPWVSSWCRPVGAGRPGCVPHPCVPWPAPFLGGAGGTPRSACEAPVYPWPAPQPLSPCLPLGSQDPDCCRPYTLVEQACTASCRLGVLRFAPTVSREGFGDLYEAAPTFKAGLCLTHLKSPLCGPGLELDIHF